MSTKQTSATISGHSLQVPALIMRRRRTAQATADCKAAASISTGDTIDLTNADGETYTGEYRKTGSGSSNFDIDISSATTATQVATATVQAIAAYSTNCLRMRVSSSGATITFKFYDQGLPASNTTPSNSSGTPLENITTFEDDTDPLPNEETTASIAAPTISDATFTDTGTSGTLDGDYYYKISYLDIISGDVSPLSGASALQEPDGGSNGKVTISFGTMSSAAPARATHIDVWRTTNGSETSFRHLKRVAVGASSHVDETADGSLSITIPNSFSLPQTTSCPDLDDVVAFNGRLFGVKDSVLYWTEFNRPSGWMIIPYGGEYIGGRNAAKNITLRAMGDSLIIYKAASIHVVDYNTDPARGIYISDAYVGKGALNKKCVAVSDERHFVLDAGGVYVYEDLTRVQEVSGPIQAFIDRMNRSQSDKFSIVATRDYLYCFMALDADTECQWCMTLDLRIFRATGLARWWVDHFDHKIADSCTYTFGSSAGVDPLARRTVACVQDTRANIYMMNWLTTDGTPSNLLYSGTVTAIDNSGTGSVGRITHAETRGFTGTWNSSTYNALGLNVRFVKSDGSVSDPFQVTQVDSNARVELDQAFSSAELSEFDGATFYLGTIHTVVDSKEFVMGEKFANKQLGYAYMNVDPSPYEVGLNYYVNRDRRGAEYMQATVDGGHYEDADGSEGQTVKMGGAVAGDGASYGTARVPVGSAHFNTFQYRLEGWEPGRPWALNEIYFKDKEKRGPVSATKER